MDALPLDPGGYKGTYKLVGGRLALDLVNTIAWRDSDREHDWLSTPRNIEMWLKAVGLPSYEVRDQDVETVGDIRRILAAVLRPLAAGDHPTRDSVANFNTRLSTTQKRRVVDPVSLRWTWSQVAHRASLLDPVVLDAAEIITAESHQRLGHCPTCDWLFEDQTRNGRRRWCDMADCGSRAKSRSYYDRTKE